MANKLRNDLLRHNVNVSPFEAARCYAAREFFDPASVCTSWKAAENALKKAATIQGLKHVMSDGGYEVGLAGHDDRPCMVLHAQRQNPTTHEPAASLLSTLWACDAAVGSQNDGTAKLTVGYNFEGAGLHNFPLSHALPFSSLFLFEYPAMVGDVYLIKMPWVLRQILPLFRPLVSRRVRLVSVDSMDDFEKAAGYKRVAGPGQAFSDYVQNVVPQAASLLHAEVEQDKTEVDDHQRLCQEQPSRIASIEQGCNALAPVVLPWPRLLGSALTTPARDLSMTGTGCADTELAVIPGSSHKFIPDGRAYRGGFLSTQIFSCLDILKDISPFQGLGFAVV
jgi:hypothetical protein